MRKLVLGTAAVAAVAAVAIGVAVHRSGDSSRRDVLYAGVGLGRSSAAHRVDDAEARRDAATTYRTWRAGLRQRASSAPRQHFHNPSEQQFQATLRALARRHGFTVVSSTLLRPRQLAPAVVVQTSHYEQLARAFGRIDRALNPKRDTGDDRTGWRWEGFFLQAVDERGVPFIAAFDSMRGADVNGGQWARSDALFPFPHG